MRYVTACATITAANTTTRIAIIHHHRGGPAIEAFTADTFTTVGPNIHSSLAAWRVITATDTAYPATTTSTTTATAAPATRAGAAAVAATAFRATRA